MGILYSLFMGGFDPRGEEVNETAREQGNRGEDTADSGSEDYGADRNSPSRDERN